MSATVNQTPTGFEVICNQCQAVILKDQKTTQAVLYGAGEVLRHEKVCPERTDESAKRIQ